MRTLLQVLTDQSTIIFTFFRRPAQPGGENSHARGEGTKSVVALHLNQDSILIGSWRNQIRIHLSLIANRGFWGRRDMPDLEFCIFGIVGRHLTRAHVCVRQAIRLNIHKGFNLSGDDARVLWPERRRAECERFNFRIRSTSRIACGSYCAPWSELTINSDCAPGRCELQYGTTPSELFGVSPRPRSPMIE